MSIVHPRYRVINFRLSSEEYESVYNAGEASGSRSISEFARSAVLEKAARAHNGQDISEQLRSLENRFERVEKVIQAIHHRLDVIDETF